MLITQLKLSGFAKYPLSERFSFLYVRWRIYQSFFTFVELVVCILLHSSSICSCVSFGSPHLRQITSLYLPLKLFFTSSILVRALKMVDASILLSLFMYVFLVPGLQVVLFSRYCVLVFPSAFLFIVSANFVMMSIFAMVSVFCTL